MALVLRPPGSRETLPVQLADLGRTRKVVAVATGVLTLAASILGCVALTGILDAALHLPPLVRALALVITLVLGGVLWIRGVVRSLALRTDALSIALELEDRYPALNDAVASAVSFLDGPTGEERGVSDRLEAAAVRTARRLADRYEFARLVPSGACWRAAWAFGLMVAVIVPLILVNTSRAATALVRLADPFGVHPWPTKTRIELVTPSEPSIRIPCGDPFDLKFLVHGVLKERATATFRFAAGDEFEEQYPLAASTDPHHAGAAVVSAKLDPNRLPGSFTFRVTSNDADTGWRTVEVVPPPRLMPLDGRPTPQFKVEPPAYTGLPAIDLPDGAAVLEVPVGTVVRMRAATDVRLSAARLSFLGDRSATEWAVPLAPLGHIQPFAAAGVQVLAGEIGADIPLALDSSGRVLAGAFSPSASGMYALRLTDETGLTGTRLVEIRLAPDPAPEVTLQRPSAGRDPSVVTPDAAVAVRVSADDKFYGLGRTVLEYRVGRDGPVREIPLADFRTTERTVGAMSGLLSTVRVRPMSVAVGRRVYVREFLRDDGTPARDGDTIFLRGAADDWDDVSPVKEPGRSGERELGGRVRKDTWDIEIHVASAGAIEAWVERELAQLRPELLRARDHQRDARNRTLDAAPTPEGTLTPADRDRLLAAEQLQRQIRGKVGDPRDGLRAKADALRETIRANELPRSNTTDRVERVADVLAGIADRDLQAIEPSLADARQFGAQPPRPSQEQVVPDLLKRAGRHQKAVEDGLTNLLDLLGVWGGASEVRGEARALRDQVTRHADDTDKLKERVPGGAELSTLSPAQRAELDRAAARAEQTAEQAGSLLARAARYATEKDKQAAEARTAAADADARAAALREKAQALPPGTPERSTMNAEANAHAARADELRATAEAAKSEADALRTSIQEGGGQSLPDELRQAADALRNNQQDRAAKLQRSAAGRLDRMVDALAEKSVDTAPDLKKWKSAADDLNTLADAQDDLRKRTADAAKLGDPAQRQAELKRLAAEQDKLIERGRELLQRLNRERADSAARDTREAVNRMEAARDDLEQGNSGTRTQNDAVDRLDAARDKLDAASANPQERLADETRRKMADKVNGLLERQKARLAEATRIHKLVATDKEWKRAVIASYIDLAEEERKLAADVKALEKDFAPLPVLARVLAEAATAADGAADKITTRKDDIDPALAFDAELETANDRKVMRPMTLAARRLEQLLDALKQDDPKAGAKKGPGGAKGQGPKGSGNQPQAGGGGDQDIVPPLAQLKVLKALQADLNQMTSEFATAHPDPAKLTDEEREELKELEQAQRDIAGLFEQMAKLFDEQKQPKSDPPRPDDPPAPEKK